MATEKLYRRGADGIMEEVVPEARGKAAAFDRWLAQGGKPFNVSGRFKEGPMKGLTYDQAKQKFEVMWASSPDAIKEKYAARSQTDLAPSERKIQGMEPTPKDMSPAAVQRRRMASYGHEFDANGVAVPIKRQMGTTPARAATVKHPAQTSFAPGSDEARAAALTANSRNERFATADTGDGGMAAAIAMDKYQGRPVSAPVEKTPIEGAIDSAISANTRFWDRTTNAVNSAISAPFTPASERIVGAESESAHRALEAKRAADAEAAQQKLTQENAARLRAEKGLPAPVPSTAQPVAAQSAQPSARVTPTPTRPEARPTLIPAMQPTPTGAPVMDDAPRGVNRLTGLPMGHLPGDALPQKFAGDRQMQGRAADSLVRQQFAAPITAVAPQAKPLIPGITPMPRGPASQPTPTGSTLDDPNNAFSKQAYARTAAAEAQGVKRQEELSKAVNVDDPKKFFTGRVLPLDQLVKRQKLQGIGTPARQ